MSRPNSPPSLARYATLAIALASAAIGSTAFAQQASPQSGGAMPAMQTQGALQYACGGIGIDESTAMRAAMKDHPLSLLFAAAGGAYQADVQVTLRPEGSGAGQPLTFTATGPVCLLTVPAGKYAVEAIAGGQKKQQSVTVGQGAKTLDFRF